MGMIFDCVIVVKSDEKSSSKLFYTQIAFYKHTCTYMDSRSNTVIGYFVGGHFVNGYFVEGDF